MTLQPDVKIILEYLENVSDRKTFQVATLDPNKVGSKPKISSFTDSEEAAEWIAKANAAGLNIYEQFNQGRRGLKKKPKKQDVEQVFGFHADVDMPPEDELEDRQDWIRDRVRQVNNLPGVHGRPSIIMTGNGIQIRWDFKHAADADHVLKERIERVNAQIAAAVDGGDNCHNIDRLLRVPGTVNWPSEKKRKAGRKPVLAELLQIADGYFDFEDFEELPPVHTAHRSVAAKYRVDYRNRDYSRNYNPVTWKELLREDPRICDHVHEMLDADPDRSRAFWGFANDVIASICHIFDEDASQLIDDTDIYKNIVELALDSDLPFLDKYEEEDNFALMGRDVHICMLNAAEGESNTARTRRRAAANRREYAKPEAAARMTPLEHRQDFIDHMRRAIRIDDLPNCRVNAEGGVLAVQNVTEANLRKAFEFAGVRARWDAMKDEASYDIVERAGRALREDDDETAKRRILAPRLDFQGALRNISADMLSPSQESLLADALHEIGLQHRDRLSKPMEIIAKEQRFHPVEDYATAEPWDGRRRISEVADCLQSDHKLKELYVRLFFRQCVAAVKSLRQYQRNEMGVMLGSVAILVGKQGIGKTTFWRLLTPPGMLSKGSKLVLGGPKESDMLRSCLSGLVTILDEFGAGMNYTQTEEAKNFFTATNDDFRVAYGHWPTKKPRMTVFVGTSNDLHLRDDTGSRRFLVMDVSRIDLDRLEDLLDSEPGGRYLQQCYAEAWKEIFQDNQIWWLEGEDDDVRAEYNADYREESEEIATISGYLDRATDRHRDEWLTVTEIFKLLNLKFSPVKARQVRAWLMNEARLEYRERLRRKDEPHLRRVFLFPATTDGYSRAVSSL